MGWDPPVSRRLMEFLSASSAGTVAAFDADGTIWSEDVGESFLKWAGEEGKLSRWPKGPWAWVEYERRLSTGDLRHAFDFCVTAFADMKLDEVTALAKQFVAPAWEKFIYPEMRTWIKALSDREVEIWVVSGSPKWCVAPGAALLGIPANRVIGGEPATKNGVVLESLATPLPIRETKAERLLAAAGRPPHFAAGNSEYDFDLLESARTISLLIDPEVSADWGARKNGATWLVQRWKSTPVPERTAKK